MTQKVIWRVGSSTLIIGNAKYEHFSTLSNPPSDAREIAAAFKDAKFDYDMLESRLMTTLKADARVARELPEIEAAVANGTLLPTLAVDRIMGLMAR